MKRTMASLLALLLLAACLPLTASAEAELPSGDAAAAGTEEPDATAGPDDAEPTQTPAHTQTPAPTQTPEPTAPAGQAVQLRIDDANVYEGMDRAYKDGYVPQVSGGKVTLIMPLVATGAIWADRITVTPELGEASGTPVQVKNYQKTFSLADNPVNVTGEEGETVQTVSSYLVRFDLPLRSDRKNGTYPIALDVQATDDSGGQIIQSFTCYITITDGKKESASTPVYGGGGGVTPTETPMSAPRVLVSKYTVDKTPVMAGEDFTVTVTLENTSAKEDVQNMLVTVSGGSEDLVLKNDTSTIFLGDLKAGGTTQLKLRYGTDRETPAQRYTIDLAMEFDDEDAMSFSSSGSVAVEVAQPVEVELAPFTMPGEINAGETVQLTFQVMNLGRTEVYNVRVELEVPGLSPNGNAFIGNMEAGTSATETLNVFAGMKEGDERYGWTSGVARLIYEDAGGEEYTQEMNVSTNVKELVIATKDPVQEQEAAEKEQAQRAQWWVFVAAGAAVIAVLAGVLWLRKRNAVPNRHVKK